MILERYIHELLREHDTVIVPRFGAFISEYKPAWLNEDIGEMTPPSSEIRFDRKIRHNDGLLAEWVAAEENISIKEANKIIDSEREEILYKLDKGETVSLENFGTLFYSKNQEIEFTYTGKDNLLMDSFGLGATSLKDEPEIPEESEEEERIPEILYEETEMKQASAEPFEEAEHVMYSDTSLKEHGDYPERRKGNKAWWLLLFLIPLLGAGVYIMLRQQAEQPSQVMVKVEEPLPERQVQAPADTTREVGIVAETDDNGENADYSGLIRPNPSSFYLVRGSFEDLENARKYSYALKEKGYQPFHLGKHGSFYLVGIDSFSNKTVAYGQQYNYLDKYPESGVWIFIPEQTDTLIHQ